MNPLSAIFGAGVALRNTLYDRRLLPVCRLSRPVVSIGNLSVGGSGKTPFVIALGQLLAERGICFDVLSRGYGRRSTEVAVVDPQGSAEQFGDEPLLIARKTNAPVFVGADRYQAGLLAEKNFASKLHLLDDGFQHRRLHRDFDIVMVSASDFHDKLLPVGRQREPMVSLRRADAVVLDPKTNIDESKNNADSLEILERIMAHEEGRAPRPLEVRGLVWHAKRELEIGSIRGRVVAFCGIAKPSQFFEGLKKARLDVVHEVAFADHHHYQKADIERLLASRASTGAEAFVTTEKDFINLGELAGHLEPISAGRLKITLEDPLQALDHLLRTLEQGCGCRF